MRMIALEKDISESKIGRKRTLHFWIIQLRAVVPCALISPRAEMCEQSELSELSLLLFPGRASPVGSGRNHFLPSPSGAGTCERSNQLISVPGKVPDLSGDWD